MTNPIDDWFRKRLDEIKTSAHAELSDDIEHAGQVGKMLVDYFFLQLNGIGITTTPVKRAEPVNDLPEGFRG